MWSMALLALRIDRLAAEGTIEPALGRDALFLVNNLLFVLFTFTVLVGTVFPLLVEALRGVQMSVGRPYFDRMAVPLGVALLLLMGVGPALPWGRATPEQVRKALLPPLAGAFVFAAAGFALGARRPWTLVALAFGGFTAQVTLRELWLPLSRRMRAHGESAPRAFVEAEWRRGRRRFGSYLVHAGAVVAIIAIAVSSTTGVSKEVQLRVGERTELGRYTLTFLAADEVSEPHRQAIVARVGVSKGGKDLGVLSPRMNQYERQREPIGTPAVRTALFEDLYLSVMNIDAGRGELGLMAMVNPMVGWIWVAVVVMALGSLVALVPPRTGVMVVRAEAKVPAGGRAAVEG
jgi:cytochrome c-type biogenesis protein CcmF